MSLEALFFYIFSGAAVISASLVIIARNPVHAVLFLILTFFSAAGLFVLLGAEFLAMLLVIVYVGAVAVLFLFVVMMLDVDFADLRSGFVKNAPLGAFVGAFVLFELILILGYQSFAPQIVGQPAAPMPAAGEAVTNTVALGRVLYTQYVFVFQVAGLILLVAMVGAIVLTLRHKEGVKRQSISAQVSRNPAEAIEVVNVAPGQAIMPSRKEGS